ncbi:MAG: amidohydrolase family protein [Verrucomicrobiota bacterium]|nr:amidohydrolase family protein [Verrucomicrobiota bacterium]
MPIEPPIFDCLTHPALDGGWVHPRWAGGNTFQALHNELAMANVPWAFAVAMGTGDGWALERYVQACAQPGPILFPVAWCDPAAPPDFAAVRAMGYCGVKMHPRLAGFEVSDTRLSDLIQAAHAAGLILFLCTWPARNANALPGGLSALERLLDETSGCRKILLHAGGPRLKEVAAMAGSRKDVLLDLSYTLCTGRVTDEELRAVLADYSGQFCVGSDSPEISPVELRARFDQLCADFDAVARENIACGNLFAFTGLPRHDANASD